MRLVLQRFGSAAVTLLACLWGRSTAFTSHLPHSLAPVGFVTRSAASASLEEAGDGLDVVFEDEHLAVLVKPSGLLSVPGKEIKDSLATRAAKHFGKSRIDRMIVHRLDMATSGLLVVALEKRALARMHDLFREKKVTKRYTALVHGVLDGEGEVDVPIRKDPENPPLSMADPVHGKPCVTRWAVTGRGPSCTRVALSPVTGRSHQLRVHMAALGHPILGDYFYASGEALEMAPRCCLHAEELSFAHPITGEQLVFHNPAPF